MSVGHLSLVTPPNGEPLTLAEAKLFSRIDQTEDDSVVWSLITAARRAFDGKDAWFGRALLTQTWDLSLDAFPSTDERSAVRDIDIVVPLPPLQSITSITYLDGAGASQTLPAPDYLVDTKCEPGRITPAYGKSWPSTRNVPNAVTVRFVAGYGGVAAVPEDIKTWLKQAVDYLYANRTASSLPSNFFWSMANYRVTWGL